MSWAKYDVRIEDGHFRTAHGSYALDQIENIELLKEDRTDWSIYLFFGGAAAIALFAISRCQNLPYETGMSPFNDLKFVLLLFLGAGVLSYLGMQRSDRAADVTFTLNALVNGTTKKLYSHSDEKVVKEIKAALQRSLGRQKR